MERIEFSPAVKRLIAERAGLRCSYPGCGASTNGPGEDPGAVSRAGFAAHIYSAAKMGPRGRGGLSDEEIGQAENGIWLCGNHAKLVDNNDGVGHPAETLLSYKGLHEARIKGEVLGIYPAIGWIHEVSVESSGLFAPGAKARFGKLNLLFGENGTGKTSLWEYVCGAFDPSYLGSWSTPLDCGLDVRISYLRPQPTVVRVRVGTNGGVRYDIDGRAVPFNPLPIRVVCMKAIQYCVEDDEDDRTTLARILGLPTWQIDNLVDEVNLFSHARVRNVQFKVDEESGVLRLYADVEGTVPGLAFRLLSGREQERVFIEFATAAARVSGRYTPTLLVLDNPFILFKGWFEFYAHHLLDPANQFQTIMCIPTRTLDLDAIRWNGWEVIRTTGTRPHVSFSQEPRTNSARSEVP